MRFKLKTSLIISAFAIFALLGLMVLLVINQDGIQDRSMTVKEKSEDAERSALRVKYFIVQIQQFLTDASLTGDKDSLDEARKNLKDLKASLSEVSSVEPALSANIQKIDQESDKLFAIGTEMVDAYQKMGKEAGDAIMKRPETGLDAMSEAIATDAEELYKKVSNENSRAKEEFHASVLYMRNAIFFFVGFAILAISLVFYILYRRIRPLDGVAKELFEQSRKIMETSLNLAKTSSDLSESAALQSSSAQQTAASLVQINSMVEKTAENAERMRRNSTSSSEAIQDGSRAVQSMTKTVDEIRTSSQVVAQDVESGNQEMTQIVQVIAGIESKTKVINDIVFQTKLLSFNASVEAARAGENGKGFSVVAEEVGNLAAMSGNAAQEISQMVMSGVTKVEQIVKQSRQKLQQSTQSAEAKTIQGIENAKTCGEMFNTITENVRDVTISAGEISEAISSQKLGLTEISKALQDFEQTTQENLKKSHDTSRVAEILEERSTGLNSLVETLSEILNGKTAA